jgi:hypothetical protein
MKNTFIHFFKSFTLYTIVIALLSSAIYWWVPAVPVSHIFLLIILFMYVLTLVLLRLLFLSMQRRLSQFVNAFMLVNFGKLFLYTIIIFIYAYLNRGDAVSFITTFFVYYLLFTSYEIVVLLKVNR